LAGISSFIFQLPLQLLFLECHVLEQEYLEARKHPVPSNRDVEAPVEEGEAWVGDRGIGLQDVTEVASEVSSDEETPPEKNSPSVVAEKEVVVQEEEPVVPLLLWLQFARRGDVWKRIMINLFKNPVIWGIAGGFFLSLTTIGPRFLKPNSDENVPGLAWFFSLTEWLGACK
jgi:hypothetical protein